VTSRHRSNCFRRQTFACLSAPEFTGELIQAIDRDAVAAWRARYRRATAFLLDDVHLGWDEAWDLTQKTLAYTNHTLLPEALEKWPFEWFNIFLPRHLEIILEINRRLLISVRDRFPGDEGRVRGPRGLKATRSRQSQ